MHVQDPEVTKMKIRNKGNQIKRLDVSQLKKKFFFQGHKRNRLRLLLSGLLLSSGHGVVAAAVTLAFREDILTETPVRGNKCWNLRTYRWECFSSPQLVLNINSLLPPGRDRQYLTQEEFPSED